MKWDEIPNNLLGLVIPAIPFPMSALLIVGGLAFEQIEAAKMGMALLLVGALTLALGDVFGDTAHFVVSLGSLVLVIGAAAYFHRTPRHHTR